MTPPVRTPPSIQLPLWAFRRLANRELTRAYSLRMQAGRHQGRCLERAAHKRAARSSASSLQAMRQVPEPDPANTALDHSRQGRSATPG